MIGGAKGIGLGIDLGLVNQYNRTGSQSYIEPEVLDSLVGVWSAYGMTNDSPNRSTIKNKLSNKGGDFVISNAAFKLNSGFGKYEVDFATWKFRQSASENLTISNSSVSIKSELPDEWIIWQQANSSAFKIRIKGLHDGGQLRYRYFDIDNVQHDIFFNSNGDFDCPANFNTGKSSGFAVEGTKTIYVGLSIEQIPSNKNFTTTNNLRNENRVIGRNTVTNIGKTGIYGWYKKDIQGTTATLIDNILGDKNDYTGHYTESTNPITNSKFYVTGYAVENGFTELSSVAWYWTIIANKVLTTDQINQVIAYFNLDRTLKSDIYCNIAKQGITNENHAEFGDKLIDFSGNGRDIQLNNLAWDGDSGIGKYNYPNWKVNVTQGNKYARIVYYDSINGTYSANFKGITDLYKSYGLSIEIRVNRANTIDFHSIKEDGIYTITPPDDTTSMDIRFGGEDVYNASCNITITQIPSHAGALCLDGVNDFGQFVGDLGLKDYTFIMDREYLSLKADQVPVISSINPLTDTPFIFEHCVYENRVARPFSFGKDTVFEQLASKRFISYQSTYKYNGKDISKGTSVNTGSGLTIGRYGDDRQYANFAFYFLMLFPYSMSEFLIERQLKKHKLGTLYPDMVEFRPIVKGGSLFKYLNVTTNEEIFVGDYIHVGDTIRFYVSGISGTANEVSSFTVNGVEGIPKGTNGDLFDAVVTKSPQKINITIDQYIRYEDIVQPYPVLLRFNDENGNEVSWGGKFRVGSTITRIDSIADPESNLLNGLYSISGLSLNDKAVTSSTSIVEKQMVFRTTATWLLDNNEPKCILSPRLLRIPNSSYKILGHIPDISGHGNHGVIHNSAYEGASGANGYLQNFSEWTKASGVSSTDSVISSSNNLVAANGWIAYVTSGTVIPTFKVEISGIPINGNLRFEGSDQTLVNGVNTIQGLTTTKVSGFYISNGYDNDWSNLRIEQIGEYEGAYCLDGVDDFITIPTVTGGGKQVFMKIYNNTINSMLYDQRSAGASPNSLNSDFAIYNTNTVDNNLIAYQSRLVGKTYIDGILNTNITCEDLLGVLHNITITCDIVAPNNGVVPNIGRGGVLKDLYSNMALYDFMLFDNISTDDKIKELNEYVGIEAKVELPPYYWDAYGKTNLDADKATIQQRGVAVGDYDITNYNHAYDKMSGYGGYAFAKFDNTTEWTTRNREDGIEIIKRNGYSFTAKRIGTGQYFYDFQNRSTTVLNKSLTVKAVSNNNTYIRWEYKYRTAKKPDVDSTLLLVRQAMTPNVPITVTLPYKTEQEKADLGVTEGSDSYLFYFDPTDIPLNREYTVEMLPLYPNGLVYDGVVDYSENVNIPALTDYTYIFKRELLDNVTGAASITKGLTDQQRAFIVDYINTTGGINGTSFGNMAFVPSLRDTDIIYGTTNSVNGTNITKGSNPDSNGIDIGRFVTYCKKMVFYKLILYPKTIPLLQINFLKNLMERDEIIDLNNPIFIQE